MVDRCAFCEIVAGSAAAQVVLDTGAVVAFLDRTPVFPGHVLVVPRDHIADLPALPDSLLAPYFEVVRHVSARLPAAVGAEGTFVATNNSVSQSVPHLHTHVVPRRRKDGLRGFFWPRHRYRDEAEMAAYGDRVRAALALA
ncbi:MAG: HIT family protein [Acidimicrobiia bacterium]|nr:HIT family protein [Acidimicrobiia bacterium]